jgi:valyl-tRNA synthetase
LEVGNPTPSDEWILSELDSLIAECERGYNEYNFFIPAVAIREFTWNIFAAQYIEMVKARAYGLGFSEDEKNAAIFTLHKILSTILKLLAPIIPLITEYLWQKIYSSNSIHTQRQVKRESHKDLRKYTEEIIEFNSKVWNEKKSKGLSLKDSIAISIPSNLEIFKKDLKAMHNLE